MTDTVKKAIKLELASIRDVAEDELIKKEVLEQQLTKATELHKAIEEGYGDAYTLCSDIEEWIEEMKVV